MADPFLPLSLLRTFLFLKFYLLNFLKSIILHNLLETHFFLLKRLLLRKLEVNPNKQVFNCKINGFYISNAFFRPRNYDYKISRAEKWSVEDFQ